jgi:hypothetical protein
MKQKEGTQDVQKATRTSSSLCSYFQRSDRQLVFGKAAHIRSKRHRIKSKTPKETSILPRLAKTKPLEQRFLDFGQKDFAQRKICHICGTMFVSGLAEDNKEHERVCKEYRCGVLFKSTNYRRVAQHREDFIIEVSYLTNYTGNTLFSK